MRTGWRSAAGWTAPESDLRRPALPTQGAGDPELVCPGFFVDVATWAGAPLREVLEEAG